MSRYFRVFLTFLFFGPIAITRGEDLPVEAVQFAIPSTNLLNPKKAASADLLNRVEKSLATLARNADLPRQTRSQMVATGLTIAPENKTFTEINRLLEGGQSPAVAESSVDLGAACQDLTSATMSIHQLWKKSGSPDSRILSGMLLDICSDLPPRNYKVIYARDMYRRHESPIPWHKMLKSCRIPVVAKHSGGGSSGLSSNGITPSSRQSGINGLLIRELDSGGMAGKASRMSATWLLRVRETEMERESARTRLRFNQEVGEMMQGSLGEVSGLLRKRHGKGIGRGVVEFAFQDKFVPKDGDSAGLACSLMIEGLVTGNPIDPSFTCTGAIRSDGSVRAIGGVLAKLRGAQKFGSKVVVVPLENQEALSDMVLLGLAADLAKMQVFTAENFDEGWELAQSKRTSRVQSSINEFNKLQRRFSAGDVMTIVKTPEARANLEKVLRFTPNHASAKLMLQTADGKLPKTLSFNGSIEEFYSELGFLRPHLKFIGRRKTVQYRPRTKEQSASTTRRLKRLAGLTHEKAKKLGSQVWKLNSLMRQIDLEIEPAKDVSRKYEMARTLHAIGDELERLSRDPELNEKIDSEKLDEEGAKKR